MTRFIRWLLLELLIFLARVKEPFVKTRTPVFVYHSIDESDTSIALAPRIFEQHLGYLRKHKYKLISGQAAIINQQNDTPEPKSVVLTFDDAYTTIKPWLENLIEHNENATVFIPSACIGQSNLWDAHRKDIAQIEIMTAEQLRELKQKGCDLGAHTRTHPNLTELSDEELATELQDVRTDLQQTLQDDANTIAYPYGAHNDNVIQATNMAGYTAGFTTQLGYLDAQTELLKIPRFPTNISFQVFRLIVHGGYGWYRKLQDRIFG